MTQPVQQLVSVRRGEDLVERALGGMLQIALGHRQEVEVVIAEHHHRLLTQIAHEAHHGERLWSAIDQIAHQPELIAGRVEAELIEQIQQLTLATLDITDGID